MISRDLSASGSSARMRLDRLLGWQWITRQQKTVPDPCGTAIRSSRIDYPLTNSYPLFRIICKTKNA